MTKQSNRALALHFYEKFPHLFNPKTFSVSLSATREKVEEAFRILKLSENHTDLAGFKKLFSLWGDDYDGMGDSLFPSKNASTVKEMATEPTTTTTAGAATIVCSDDDDESAVRFDFGSDYGSRREFVELGKELLFWNLWYVRVPRRGACRVSSKYGEEDDVFELWSTEEVLKEFAKNNLF